MSKRRSPGEGSAYQIADGSWRGFVDLGSHEGRRRRKYVRGRTKAEVQREIRRLVAEAEEGRLRRDRAPTLAVWLERYLTEVASMTVRPSTLHRYRQEVRLYIAPSLGKVRIDQLRPNQVDAFYQDQLRHLSAGSVRRLHALLRRALTVAVRWRIIPASPIAAVDPPAIDAAEVRPYNAAEALRFLRAVKGHRFEARWMLAIMLGMRQGEVLGLAWNEVHLDQRTAYVRQALQYRPGDGLHLARPKTARSRRTVPLPDQVLEALKLQKERQDRARDDAGEFWEEWGLVFTTAAGTPVSPRNDYRDFRKIIERAGLRRVRLHDLRHTAASLMLAQDVSPRVIMEVLGHSQISVTMNTYSHISEAQSREAADRMGDLFQFTSGPPLAATLAADDLTGASPG
jgi:integrase